MIKNALYSYEEEGETITINKGSGRHNHTSMISTLKMLSVVIFFILFLNFNNHGTTLPSCLAWTSTRTIRRARIQKSMKSTPTTLTFTRSSQQQHQQQQQQQQQHTISKTRLYIKNLLNNINIPNFLQQRQNDFIPIYQSKNKYGPGPCILLIDIPNGIGTDEIYNMIADTCSKSTEQHCKLYRINTTNTGSTSTSSTINKSSSCESSSSLNGIDLDTITVQEMMEQISNGILVTLECSDNNDNDDSIQLLSPATNSNIVVTDTFDSSNADTNDTNSTNTIIPVLLFSGFDDKEMIQLYNVIANEIYQEDMSSTSSYVSTTTKVLPPACSKLVPKSKNKSINQILYEIRGDHFDATTKAAATASTTTTSTSTSTSNTSNDNERLPTTTIKG